MNKRTMKLWIKKLRSNEYQQARGSLAANIDGERGYCCLGVACLAYNEANPETALEITEEDNVICFDGEDAILPARVVHWLGVPDVHASLRDADGLPTDGPTMNDHRRLTFEQIADEYEAALNA